MEWVGFAHMVRVSASGSVWVRCRLFAFRRVSGTSSMSPRHRHCRRHRQGEGLDVGTVGTIVESRLFFIFRTPAKGLQHWHQIPSPCISRASIEWAAIPVPHDPLPAILPVRGEGIVGNGNGGGLSGLHPAASSGHGSAASSGHGSAAISGGAAASSGHGSALLGPGDTLVGRRWVFLGVYTTSRQV